MDGRLRGKVGGRTRRRGEREGKLLSVIRLRKLINKIFFLQWKVQCFNICMLAFHSLASSLLYYTTQTGANAPVETD